MLVIVKLFINEKIINSKCDRSVNYLGGSISNYKLKLNRDTNMQIVFLGFDRMWAQINNHGHVIYSKSL